MTALPFVLAIFALGCSAPSDDVRTGSSASSALLQAAPTTQASCIGKGGHGGSISVRLVAVDRLAPTGMLWITGDVPCDTADGLASTIVHRGWGGWDVQVSAKMCGQDVGLHYNFPEADEGRFSIESWGATTLACHSH